MQSEARVAGRGLNPAGLFAVLIGATLAAWLVLLVRMRGMDAGPGRISARSGGTSGSG